MALISPQAIAVTGTAPTFSAPSASDTLVPRDRGVYIVRTTGTSTNVELVVEGTDEFGQARPNVTVACGATAVTVIPLTAYTRAVSPSTGLLTVTHSGALTGVTSCFITV
jgi:hypothetical protein